ncbi:MAG: HAMP domain-containing protein [Chloroflexi bacterium]|nr:HAMP domain-containing protein [Chloroflexota bacterium]
MNFFRAMQERVIGSAQKRFNLGWLAEGLSNTGLSQKILLIIVGVSLIGVLASSGLVLTLQRQQLADSAVTATTRLSIGVQSSLEQAMLLNDRQMASQIIQTMVRADSVEHIRILDARGVVYISSYPSEVGTRFDYSDPTCQFCHTDQTRPSNHSTILTTRDNHRALLNVNLIYNQPHCASCHGSTNKILGVLVMEMPLTDLDNQLIAGLMRIIVSAIVTFVLMVGLLSLALERLIIRPVRDLSQGVTAIRAGNLDHALRASNRDELGALAESFEAMRAELKSSRTEMQRREREATALHRLMLNISASLDLQSVCDAIAEDARAMMDAEIGIVVLSDEPSQQIVIQACAGARTHLLKGLAIPVKSRGFISSAEPVWIEKWHLDLPIPRIADLISHEGIVSSLAAPMWLNGRHYGYVGVLTRQRRQFTRVETELFIRLAVQVVIAIENAELYRRVRPLAILEERDRLARELHDNLAQMLGYMNIKTAITDDQIATHQIGPARASLLELKQIVKEAYTDVREAIFNLRATTPGSGLARPLEEYLAEYRAHYCIDARLVIEDQSLTEFPEEVKVQVNRIIQEALTNVRKHSGAKQARVRFERSDGQIQIIVEDNGMGFDPTRLDQSDRRHFGLQIMRERAASVGGELEIESQRGLGTRVIFQLPIFPVIEDPHEDTTYFVGG